MENLKAIRNEILGLHKILMNLERENYEAGHGKVTNVQLLNLLFENENFLWLRELSGLVAQIDEMFAAKNGIDEALAGELLQKARALFDGSEQFEHFKSRYQANLDTESSVAERHLVLTDLLAK